jgi:hypothetical protein
MFGCFLCSRSFNNLEGPFSLETTLSPNNFRWHWAHTNSHHHPNNLRNWAFIILIITIKFIIDQYPFLFEALTQVNNNIFFSNNSSKWHVISPPQLVHVFLCLNNSSNNKWFNFKISSWTIYTIIPFPTCFSKKYLKHIVTDPRVGV